MKTLALKLNKNERVNFLKENREDIIQEIYFATGVRGGNELKELMTAILERVQDDSFYSNYANSFEGVNFELFIEVVYNELDVTGVSNEDVKLQEFDEKRRKEQMRAVFN